jgi:hypothetical protein
MIKATEANLAAATDRTIIIPGHGNPVSNRTELSAYRDMLHWRVGFGADGAIARLIICRSMRFHRRSPHSI